LFCRHPTDESQSDAIWSILNNEFKETVPKDKVKKMLEDLIAFAVDCPKTFYSLQEVKDENMQEYIKDLNEARKQLLDDTLSILGPNANVAKDSFVLLMVSFFCDLIDLIAKRMVFNMRD
jgi:hypothetical protein